MTHSMFAYYYFLLHSHEHQML